MYLTGEISDYGTLYAGDGCWGKGSRTLTYDSPRWYQEKTSDTQYVLRVDIMNGTAQFTAFNDGGEVFDDFHL